MTRRSHGDFEPLAHRLMLIIAALFLAGVYLGVI